MAWPRPQLPQPTRRLPALMLTTLTWGSALAQTPLLHLPLDGSYQNVGSLGGQAELHVADDALAPTFVTGYRGEALEFDSRAVLALPFGLDHADYPQVTITAWVRQPADASNTRAVLSGGSISVARLGVNGGRLAARAGRSGVTFDRPMPVDEWVFVAAVIDMANGWARLHQNDGVYLREGLDTRSSPRSYRDPDDPDAPADTYLFIGAAEFRTYQQAARSLGIDDVRLYLDALSPEQIDSIRARRSLGEMPVSSTSGVPQTGPSADFDIDADGIGAAVPDIGYDSEEEARIAQERRDREAGQAELTRQQNELEAERRAAATAADAGSGTDDEPAPERGPRYFSDVLGEFSDQEYVIETPEGFMTGIGVHVDGCRARLYGDSPTSTLRFCLGNEINLLEVGLSSTRITAIEVCRFQTEIIGLRIFGDATRASGEYWLREDADFAPVVDSIACDATDSESAWTRRALCPGEHFGTGLVLHVDERDPGFTLAGLQLICRPA